MKIRFVYPVGTRASLRIYWNGYCPNSGGSYHNAMTHLADSGIVHDSELGGDITDHFEASWPTKCDGCGTDVPKVDITRQVFRKTLYAEDTGSWQGYCEEPGNVFYADWYPCAKGGGCIWGWTNCNGKHLIVILPNKGWWDTNSRASNCTKPDDKTHRCWCVHGDPKQGNVHVDKSGETCNAGAGSIIIGDWHGFLHGGELKKC